ncbi:hypothetical protein LOR37_07485 [Clostridium estertheticum]|nr:hypothetical protein [Clostridium estertheticum]WBL48490.1 hypothetical protein LOR37_07485 [Clostridium estertheticum]
MTKYVVFLGEGVSIELCIYLWKNIIQKIYDEIGSISMYGNKNRKALI